MASKSDIILCDVDGVIADCHGAVRKALQDYVLVYGVKVNGKLTCDVTVPDHEDQHFYEFEKWCGFDLDSFAEWNAYELSRDRIGWEVGLYPGAEEFIAKLRELGDLVFVTAQWPGMGCWVPARERLLQSHFPGVDIVFTHHKHRVAGAYLIDDKPATIRHPGNRGRGLLFDQPWNRSCTDLDDWRFCGYDAVLDALGAEL